jgi:hypothetical protein
MSPAWLVPRVKLSTGLEIAYWRWSRGVSCRPARASCSRGCRTIARRVSSFEDSIAEGDECVACFEFHTGGLVISAGDQSNRSRTFDKWLSKLPTAKEKWRGMASIDVFEIAIAAKNAKKHGGVLFQVGVLA